MRLWDFEETSALKGQARHLKPTPVSRTAALRTSFTCMGAYEDIDAEKGYLATLPWFCIWTLDMDPSSALESVYAHFVTLYTD